MTTAKVSTQAQKAILAINDEHKKQGLFKVELITWQRIDTLLVQHRDVWEKLYPSDQAESLWIDASISEACAQSERKNFELSRLLSQKIREQKWDRLAPRQKFRILTTIAIAYVAEGNIKEAIPLFLDAKLQQPDDEQAIANEILAYILGNKDAKAFDLATEARRKYPHSASILKHWIHTAPLESVDQLQRDMPPLLETDPDVCLALAERATRLANFGEAERLAKLALEGRPDWTHAKLVLAESITAVEELRIEGRHGEPIEAGSQSRLRFAEVKLTEVINTLRGTVMLGVKARAFLVRSGIRRLLGENQLADEDIFSARENLPNDSSVLCRYGQVLLNSGERARGITELRKAIAISGRRFDPVMCLAIALSVGELSERQEALGLFTEIAVQPAPLPPDVREDAVLQALDLVGELKASLQNSDFLSAIPEGSISTVAASTFRSKLAHARDDKSEASRQADSAIASVVDSTSTTDVRILAMQLTDLGRDEDALKLWQRIANVNSLNIDTRQLLDCASRLHRHDIILQTCEHLRVAGVDDHDLISHEAEVRKIYEPDRAIELLQEYLDRHSEAKDIRLQLSSYATLFGREDPGRIDRALLPEADEIAPSLWPLVVRTLLTSGDADGALEYAYKLLRNHFSKEEAHRAYIEALSPVRTAGGPRIETFDEVQPGTAVCFVETHTTGEQWRILEDVYEANEQLDEISSDHFHAHQLIGKKVGDSFMVAPPGVTKRTAEIRQILSKYVFRYQDCTRSFQVRFPESGYIEMIRIGPSTGLVPGQNVDLSPILTAVDIKEQLLKGAVHRYSSSHLPINALATMLGQSVFVTAVGLAHRVDVKVNCWIPSSVERLRAGTALRTSNSAVLDITAIATLWLLGLLDVLKKSKKSFIVSRGTLLEFEQLLINERGDSAAMGSLGKRGGRYFLEEESKETKADRINQVTELITLIKRSCTILTCIHVAAIGPERRHQLVRVFGQHGVESMVLASEAGRVLWTDDDLVGRTAQQEFGAQRAWTQAFLQNQLETGEITSATFCEASAKLLGYGYYFTGQSLPILLSARDIANADPDQWPLKQALHALSDEAVSAPDVLKLVTPFFVEIFKEDILGAQEATLIRVLDRLADRNDGINVIRDLGRLLPTAMGLNAIRATAAKEIITRWLSSH
jgi:tetratricopeptide (TPR) repeat protein